MAAYVDTMLVKSKEEVDHIVDLTTSFWVIQRYDLRMNPKKCDFSVKGGKFLAYMVTRRGIEPNPKKSESHPEYAAA